MKNNEAERRARLMKMRDERLPDIKKQFEEAQKRNFNSNFSEGGKDAALVRHGRQNGSSAAKRGAESASQGSLKSESRGRAANVKGASKGAKKGSQGQNKGNFGSTGRSGTSQGRSGAAGKAGNSRSAATSKAAAKKVGLGVSVRKGEMVHHQRMLSQDVNAQATQHIIGIPVNKSRYNGYNGQQVTQAQLKAARPDPEAVRIIPMGGVGEFGIG